MQSTRAFTILVVDDEPPICDLLRRVGNQLFPEATFISTRSAYETLTFFNQQSEELPQLILLDIDLHQGIDGLGLLGQLQSRLQGQVPIVMLTTSDASAARRKATDRGAVAFTRKPDGLTEWKEYVQDLKANWYGVIEE